MAFSLPVNRERKPHRTDIILRRALALLTVGVIWVSMLSFPVAEPIGLDQSWERAMGHFFKHRLQAGKDYVFTYGPLGYFSTTAFDRELFWAKYGWEVVGKLIIAAVFLMILHRMPGISGRILLVVFLLPFVGSDLRETRHDFTPPIIFALGLLMLDRSGHQYLLGLAIVLLAVLSLVKFTFLILAFGVVGIVAIFHVLAGRWKLAAGLPALFILCFLFAWLLCRQSVGDLPAYFRGSLELTRGYAEAMAVSGDSGLCWLGLGTLVPLAAIVALLRARPEELVSRGAVLASLMLLLAMQWKHGFTRQDGHAAAFFTFTLLAPFIVLAFLSGSQRRLLMAGGLAALCGGMSTAGILWASQLRFDPDWMAEQSCRRLIRHADELLAPSALLARLENLQRKCDQKWQLPKIKAIVGDHSVDLLDSMQGIVFANVLNWHPRPVFQSYCTYTPYLQRLNAGFFAGDRAPDYLLMVGSALDERLSTQDDGPALLEILRRYEPVTLENDCTLLKRRAQLQSVGSAVPIVERSVRFGEPVSLRGPSYQALTLDIERTAWGRVRSLLLRPPSIFMQVVTTSGATRRYRIVPSMVREGVLINPLLYNFPSIFRLYGARGQERLQSFTLTVDRTSASCYQKVFAMKLFSPPLPPLSVP